MAEDYEVLIQAAENGDVKVIQSLIDWGVDIRVGDNEALRLAAGNGHLAVVQLLLNHGADVAAKNYDALQRAARNGHASVVEFLAGRINYLDFLTHALVVAAEKGHVGVIEVLLKRGAVIFYNDNTPGALLNIAARNGHVPVIELLLKRGFIIRNNNNTPRSLDLAVREGHIAVVEFLLDQGADINIGRGELRLSQGAERGELLTSAVEGGQIPMIEFLISKGINLDAGGNQALRSAILRGRIDIVQVLLDRGVNIHVENDDILRLAVKERQLPIAQLLLDRGADGSVLGKKPNPEYEVLPPYYYKVGDKKELKYFGIQAPTLADPYWYFIKPEEGRVEFPDRDLKGSLDPNFVINGIEFDSRDIRFFANTIFDFALINSEGPYEFPMLKLSELRKIKDFLNGLIDVDELGKIDNESLIANESFLHWIRLKFIRDALKESFVHGVPFFQQVIEGAYNPVMRRFLNTF